MRKRCLSNTYLSAMCMELYLMLQSGISAEEGVGLLLEEEENHEAADALRQVQGELASGKPLHQALCASGCFPHYLLEMVEIGEKTGNLDRVLQSLSRHYDRQAETAQSIRSAVLYPASLLCMMLLVVIVLFVKVLPIFEDVYRQLGTTMTGAAAAVLRFGMSLTNHWPAIVLVMLALLAVLAVALLVEKSRRTLKKLFIPARIRRLIAEERFASAMAMTVANGFDLDDALSMSAKLCDDAAMVSSIDDCRRRVSAGIGLSHAAADSGVLQGSAARLLSVGVRTGSTDMVLGDIAERTQRRVLEETECWIGRIEPTLVIVMSVLVGGILLAVMLPLAGILTTLG